jgi:hypothetical protein
MIAWTRLAYLPCAAIIAAASPALAQQSPAQQADALNERGKQLFAEKRFEEAYRVFRDAATLSPEGRFFFNMCYALNFLERYEDAIDACEQVEAASGVDAALREKTQRALVSLREKLAAQQAAAGEPGGPDPGAGDPEAGDPGAAGAGAQPPPGGPDPFLQGQAPPPADSYQWSVGAEIGVMAGLKSESATGDLPYEAAGVNVRLFASFILNEAQRFGLQGYLAFGSLAPSDENAADQPLILADVGGAAFVHRQLSGPVYATPLLGVHLAVQQPQELSQAFIGLGARAEVALSYVFGLDAEHALSVSPGFNLYLPSGGTIDGRRPRDYGFDRTRGALTVNVGYTYRFSTPFGATPLITLE